MSGGLFLFNYLQFLTAPQTERSFVREFSNNIKAEWESSCRMLKAKDHPQRKEIRGNIDENRIPSVGLQPQI